MRKIKSSWFKWKWYARRLYNYLVLMMTGTIAFEGVGAVRGLKPADLVSAKIVIAVGGHRFIEIKSKDGSVNTVLATDINVGAIAIYIEVVEPFVFNGDLRYKECEESAKLYDLRRQNALKYGW